MSLKYIAKRITDGILSFFYYDSQEENDYPEETRDYSANDFSQVINEISELNSNYLSLEKKYSYLADYMTDVDKINAKLNRGEYVRTQQLKDVISATFNDNQEKYSGVRDDIKALNERIDELERENEQLRENIKIIAQYVSEMNIQPSVSQVNEFKPSAVINTSQGTVPEEHQSETRTRPRVIKRRTLENVDSIIN